MIKSKVILLEIGFYDEQNYSNWQRLNASVETEDDTNGEVELIISISSTKISIPVGDILTCIEELGIHVRAWID